MPVRRPLLGILRPWGAPEVHGFRTTAVGDPSGPALLGPVPACPLWLVLVDLARDLHAWEFRRVFLEAGRRGLLTPECLDACRHLTQGRRGRAELTKLIHLWGSDTGVIRSGLEGEFKLFCGEHGFSRPETNQPIGRYEVDVLWRAERIAIELDGRAFHGDGAAFEDNRVKGNYLAGLGYRLLRVTNRMLRDRRERADLAATLRSLGVPAVGGA